MQTQFQRLGYMKVIIFNTNMTTKNTRNSWDLWRLATTRFLLIISRYLWFEWAKMNMKIEGKANFLLKGDRYHVIVEVLNSENKLAQLSEDKENFSQWENVENWLNLESLLSEITFFIINTTNIRNIFSSAKLAILLKCLVNYIVAK